MKKNANTQRHSQEDIVMPPLAKNVIVMSPVAKNVNVASRHYHSVWGRPDEALWVEAMDKEVITCCTMGTWQVIDTADIPLECNVMGTCFSYKVKSDCDGNLLECRARANVNGTQQKRGSYGKTFAPTSKFSVIRTICAANLTL